MSVRLTLEIEAGWADWHIALGESTATITASYLSDGIGDMAASVASLLRGAADSQVTFAEEPGEYQWSFERRGDRVRILIIASPGLIADPAQGEAIVLDAECRLRTYAGQLVTELERLASEFGPAGYEKRWGYRVPTERIQEIRQLLATS
jgi:hypothetical protein